MDHEISDSKDSQQITFMQLKIAFGKYVAGYRAGDEGWCHLDQAALDMVNDCSENRSD